MTTLKRFELKQKKGLVTGCDNGLGMAGENLAYTDMDPITMDVLK